MDAVQTKRFLWDDASHPQLQVRYIGTESIHTLQVAPTGGTGSKLRVAIVTGTTTTNLDGATYTTLQSLINAINALTGWEARRADGAAEFSLDSDDFIALAATSIPRTWTSVLYKDVSSYAASIDSGDICTCRIASPDYGSFIPNGPGDGTSTFGRNKGKIEILRISGVLDAGAGAGIVTIDQDQGDAVDGSDRTELMTLIGTTGQGTAPEVLFDREPGKGLIAHGPLYFSVSSATDNEPDAVDLAILWRPVD